MSEVVTMTIGITFYLMTGQGMACGGTFTEGQGVWAAMPIEWGQAGTVACGDIAHVTLASGEQVIAPIWDFGCLLHYPVAKSLGGDGTMPYGVDLARVPPLMSAKTGIGSVKVWRKGKGRWWTPPSTAAWWTKDCDGPLTSWPNLKYEPY